MWLSRCGGLVRRLLAVVVAQNGIAKAASIHDALATEAGNVLRGSFDKDVALECSEDVVNAAAFQVQCGGTGAGLNLVDGLIKGPAGSSLPASLKARAGVVALAALAGSAAHGKPGAADALKRYTDLTTGAATSLSGPEAALATAAAWCNVGAVAYFESGVAMFHDPAQPAEKPGSSRPKNFKLDETLARTASSAYDHAIAAVQDASMEASDALRFVRAQLLMNKAEVQWALTSADAVAPTLRDALKVVEGASSARKQWKWLVARPLTALARIHHESGQAVTSEGLYRAAVASFAAPTSPSCMPKSPSANPAAQLEHLPPVGRQQLRTSMLYLSRLLAEWERREAEAELVKRHALDIAVLPQGVYGNAAAVNSVALLPTW